MGLGPLGTARGFRRVNSPSRRFCISRTTSCAANLPNKSNANITSVITRSRPGVLRTETLLVYLEGCSEKIGGPNKTVEIDVSKFGRRRYHRGHPAKGQWVLGGVERESGTTFLVPVPDRTADTHSSVIRAWIEPGTTLISDCWAAYQDIGSLGYTHRAVNRSISSANPDTGDHANTIQCTLRHVRAFLRPYHRQDDYEFHLAHYMFAATCKAQDVPQFTQLLAHAASRV